MKTCTKCKIMQPPEDFYKDGNSSWCKLCTSEFIRKSQQNTKEHVYTKVYEGKCVCKGIDCWHTGMCEIDDIRTLVIDHIHGGGSKQRKERKIDNRTLLRALKNGRADKNIFQLLCFNCNEIKRRTNNEYGSHTKGGTKPAAEQKIIDWEEENRILKMTRKEKKC